MRILFVSMEQPVMPKTPLFNIDLPVNPSQPDVAQLSQQNIDYQSIANQLAEVDVFRAMVEEYLSNLLVNNFGNFVSMLIPKLLDDPTFQSTLSDLASNAANSAVSAAQSQFNSNVSSSLGDLSVKQAIAGFLLNFYTLNPTTPIS